MKKTFALCFRPVVIEAEEPDPVEHHQNHFITSDMEVSKDIIVAKAKKKNGMNPSFLDGDNISGSLQVPCFPLPKKHSRNTLSSVLKTVLYETSPRMRIQNGKIPQLTFREKSDDHVEESSSFLEKGDHDDKQEKSKKTREASISEENIISSISSSSSCSSSTVSSSSDQSSKDLKLLSMKRSLARARSNSFDQKKRAKTTKTNDKTLDFSSSSSSNDKESFFYWIVLALLATIFWGKVYAIILASFWLYFIPSRSSGTEERLPENKAVNLPKTETYNSREYKKKIIMEGLLERKPLQQKALNF